VEPTPTRTPPVIHKATAKYSIRGPRSQLQFKWDIPLHTVSPFTQRLKSKGGNVKGAERRRISVYRER